MLNPKIMQLQKAYCETHKVPEFAPTNTGNCYSCGVDITIYITEEQASTQLITGCPYCNRSYCD